MENAVSCPVCHSQVKPTDYFCFNCGKNLKPKPPSTGFVQQAIVYLQSIFLLPYGIIIGIHYLRQNDTKSKSVGMIAILLTVVSTVIFTKLTLDLINQLNTQLASQMQQYEGF